MNPKNPAIKRIFADVKELQKHPSSRYHAAPLEEDMFQWHFTIRGPEDTPFAGGIYHGRILLPAEYPFKPPNFVFLTKNGRFEVGTKICLSISAYHEESWQPAWGVRTMLEAIISFMPTEGVGAIGALDWTADERRRLAIESHNYCCPTCGPTSALLCEPSSTGSAGADLPDPTIIAQVAQLHMTRQQSQSEKPSVYSPAHGPVHGGNRETSVIIADPAANVSKPFLFVEKKVPAMTTTVAATEESVSPQEERQISESIETFSEPIDATVAQKGRIEVVSHCITPPRSVMGTSENSFNRRQETEQTPAPDVPTSVSIPVTPSSYPFTTETLSEIRKKRIAEKQQQQQTQLFKQESSEQQPSSIQVEVPSSTGAVIFVSSPPAESSTVIPNTKGPASSQNVEIHAASRVLESNAPNVNPVLNEINSSNSNTRNPLQLPPSAQQQRQHQQQQQPPIQQPQQLQVEVQRGRGANEKIHWVLNALIGVTVGCICVLLNRILTRSLEMK